MRAIPFRPGARRRAALALAAAWAPACTGGSPAALPALQLADPPTYRACRSPRAPAVDGRLEELWDAAPWTADFRDIESGAAAPPRQRTRAKLLWDEHALYAAAELEDADVWAAPRAPGAPLHLGNAFELLLDPGADARDYYELQLNALGAVFDLVLVQPYRAGGPARTQFDLAGLRTAVQVQGTLNAPADRDRGWTLEIELPWAALAPLSPARRAPRAEESWRLNLARVHWPRESEAGGAPAAGAARLEQYSVWSPQGAVDLHRPERWGIVHFAGTPCSTPATPAAHRAADTANGGD